MHGRIELAQFKALCHFPIDGLFVQVEAIVTELRGQLTEIWAKLRISKI